MARVVVAAAAAAAAVAVVVLCGGGGAIALFRCPVPWLGGKGHRHRVPGPSIAPSLLGACGPDSSESEGRIAPAAVAHGAPLP